jgi:hypothetical protein
LNAGQAAARRVTSRRFHADSKVVAVIRSCCCLALAAFAAPALAAATAGPDTATLIECRSDIASYARSVVPLLNDAAAASAAGWTPLPRTNQYMSEFKLAAPISVFGTSTDQIAVSGGTIMAVLDQADPHPLATRLQLETGVDAPEKFMAGREVASREVVPPATGKTMIESVILSVSNVSSHPGKTLAGCTYDLDEPADPAAAPEPAPTPAAAPATTGH